MQQPNTPSPIWTPAIGMPIVPVSPSVSGMPKQYIDDSFSLDGQIPSLATVVKNLMSKHAQEIRDSLNIPNSSRTQSYLNNLKTAFRSFFSEQELHILDFFNVPVASNPTLRQSAQIIKRFGRADFNHNRVKVRDLFLDCDTKPVMDKLNSSLELLRHPDLDEFSVWIHQTRYLLDTWRQATIDAMAAEKVLESRIQFFQEIYKKTETLLSLPMSEGFDSVVASIEFYLQTVFKENEIESVYKEYVEALKKLCVLTETIGSVRCLVNSPAEPVCSVCLNEPVTIAVVPCGHTFCTSCGARQLTTCYVCRVNVKDRLRIYLS